ncbi:MAG: hypothetical protein A2042_06185 [Candidatus Schekmanbacteria bacterium GWA2_38_11]|uniref:Glycosyl transferase family 1 n=1 Tax=Candidatus Schekmanbacteria bacterium GWA2_38_11 TaxID=1817876 RepID=A0A1F7R9J4_9BACT|nr:MAG: hypothetical protein A2042_06185 [Candidatus Schekmanbacteria bacterium GWA2_38_11]
MSHKPFNILYIQGVDRLGGSIESLLGLLKGLDKERFNPVVLTSKKSEFTRELKKLNIDTEIIKMGMWRKAKSFLRIPVSIFLIQKLIRKKRIDLVHSNTLWDNPYGVVPANLRKIPSVCHLRNTFTKDKVKKYFLPRADIIICVSDEIKRCIGRQEGERAITIYNGVDIKRFNDSVNGGGIRREFNIDEKDFLIGVVGRVDRTKGQKLLINSFASLAGKYENIKLIIVGESSMRERGYYLGLRKYCNTLKLNKKAIFTGHRKDIPEITAALDLAVFSSLPSSNEGFGRSIIEAMAMKKPVIASDTGGVPEVVADGITGELFLSGDQQKLTEAIERLMLDEKRRFTMGEKGYMRVIENFTIEKNVREIEKIYLGLLKTKNQTK